MSQLPPGSDPRYVRLMTPTEIAEAAGLDEAISRMASELGLKLNRAGELPTPESQQELMQVLGQDGRRNRMAWMLQEQPLTADQIKNAQVGLKAWMAKTGHTLESTSAMLPDGIGKSLLSRFCAGKYEGDNDKVARVVELHLARMEREARAIKPSDYYEFDECENALASAQLAIDAGDMAAITGDAGAGKSTVAKVLHQLHPGSVLVQMDIGPVTAVTLVQLLTDALRLPPHGSTATRLVAIKQKIRDSRTVFIIDDAHELGPDALKVLSKLRDAGSPVVCFGAFSLLTNITDREKFFGQVERRFISMYHMRSAEVGKDGHVKPPFTVDQLVEWLARRGIRLTSDGAEFLWQCACLADKGQLGLIEQIVKVAAIHEAYRGKAIDRKICRSIIITLRQATPEVLNLLDKKIENLKLPKLKFA